MNNEDSNRPNLLFVTPVLPSPGGGGPQMRAFNNLKALAAKNRVHIVYCDVFGGDRRAEVHDETRSLVQSLTRIRLSFFRNLFIRALRFVHRHSPCLFRLIHRLPLEYTSARLVKSRELDSLLASDIDAVFAFRLYVFPLVRQIEQVRPNAVIYLDLDDIESTTRSRIADLLRRDGFRCDSLLLEREGLFYDRLERDVLPGCEKVFVTSATDRYKIGEKINAKNLILLPNVYPNRAPNVKERDDAGFTFLFIGSFAYYPNHEAAVMLCREVIQRVNDDCRTSVSFIFAGTGLKRELQQLIKDTSFADYVGPIQQIDRLYSGIDAVVVPINAGGGTRIKILEAFAYGKPVVSTPLGAEGIECENRVHLLLGEGAAAFSDCCVQLVNSPPLCESLSSAAELLLREKYNADQLEQPLLLDHSL